MIEVNELKKEYESLLTKVGQLPRTRELSLVITKLEEGLMCSKSQSNNKKFQSNV